MKSKTGICKGCGCTIGDRRKTLCNKCDYLVFEVAPETAKYLKQMQGKK
jgi:hypothetical protein